MSSISAQGVVERASAELSKRINGLGLRTKHHHNGGGGGGGHTSNKTSVMERVTNALCGGGSSSHNNTNNNNNNSSTTTIIGAPEKPSRINAMSNSNSSSSTNTTTTNNNNSMTRPIVINKKMNSTHINTAQIRGGSGYSISSSLDGQHEKHFKSDQLLQDDRFLNRLFEYFTPCERRTLAQVCKKWRDVMYQTPHFSYGLLPVIPTREFRVMPNEDRVQMYNSLVNRGFRSICLFGATDNDAYDMVHSFPLATKYIQSLSLRCSSISDHGLDLLLEHLQSLFELELAGCNEVTEAGLWSCLTPRIVSLSLADCINIADEAVGAVAQLLPSLYEFSLQAYHVTDAALGYFSAKQSNNLSILRLQSCWELTNHGIVNIVHALPHLTVLSLSGCSKVTDEGVEIIAENLQKLRILDLSWCPRITDAALEYIASDLNQLEELTLDRCVHITDIGIGYISHMFSLTALFLRWCTQIRDFGVQQLVQAKRLQVLSLAGCPLVTSSGLSCLVQLKYLQELELTNCPGASQELFDIIKHGLPRCLVIE